MVGNLIYYRYMNPAIVAPDAFDIVDISMDKGLSQDQRRNLGSIAKVLQYAASNKMVRAQSILVQISSVSTMFGSVRLQPFEPCWIIK